MDTASDNRFRHRTGRMVACARAVAFRVLECRVIAWSLPAPRSSRTGRPAQLAAQSPAWSVSTLPLTPNRQGVRALTRANNSQAPRIWLTLGSLFAWRAGRCSLRFGFRSAVGRQKRPFRMARSDGMVASACRMVVCARVFAFRMQCRSAAAVVAWSPGTTALPPKGRLS